MDHIVFLLGNHPRLRGHLAESDSESAIHAVGIAAVFQRRGGKSRRGRQRAGPIFGSMAVGANAVVDRLAALGTLLSQAGDQSGMVEIALVIRQWRGQKSRVGSERSGPRGTVFGDLHEIAHEVQKLLPSRPAHSPTQPA